MTASSTRPTWRGSAARGIGALSDERGPGALRRGALRDGLPLRARGRLDPAAPGPAGRAGRPAAAPRAGSLARPRRRAAAGSAARLAAKLAGLPEAEREAASWSWSARRSPPCSGTPRPARVDPERPFKELGFDSLAAVELRNRLGAATGAAAARDARLRPPDPGGARRATCWAGEPEPGRRGRVAGAGPRSAGARPRFRDGGPEPARLADPTCAGLARRPRGQWRRRAADAEIDRRLERCVRRGAVRVHRRPRSGVVERRGESDE